MKDILPGKKTIITGWIMALIPILGMLGYNIDPDLVASFLKEFWEALAALFALLGAANTYFRKLA